MNQSRDKIEVINAEYSIIFNGYFDLTSRGFELKERFYSFFNEKQQNLYEGKAMPNHSIQFLREDKRIYINFGINSIIISYVRKDPSDSLDVMSIREISLNVLAFLKKNFNLAFTRMSFSKKDIIVGLPEIMVNNGLCGLFINEHLHKDVKNWDLSYEKNHKIEHIKLSFVKEMTERYQIYSSKFLMNNERVICYHYGLSTALEQEAIYKNGDADAFVCFGLIEFTDMNKRLMDDFNCYIEEFLKK